MYSLACQHDMFLFITQGSVMPELVLGLSTVALQLCYSFEIALSVNLNLVEVFQTGGDILYVQLITYGSVMPELVPGSSTVGLQLHYSFDNSFKYEFESGGGNFLL